MGVSGASPWTNFSAFDPMRPKLILPLILLSCTIKFASAESHLDEYSSLQPGSSHLPPPYTDDVIFPGTTSPDGKYAFIYPNRTVLEELPSVKMYLAQTKPFRVIAEMPEFHGYFAKNVDGDFTANWAKDSSSVVAVDGSKWGPGKVYVLTLANGKLAKIVDLTAEIDKLLLPDFNRVKPDPYNDYFPYVIADDYVTDDRGDGWTINDQGQVVVNCTAITDPNNVSGPHDWETALKGLWDIAKQKFEKAKISRISGADRH